MDKEWRKLFTELPITIYWVFRAVDVEMNKAWSLPSRSLKYSTENTAYSYVTLIKADVQKADSPDNHYPLHCGGAMENFRENIWHGLHSQDTQDSSGRSIYMYMIIAKAKKKKILKDKKQFLGASDQLNQEDGKDAIAGMDLGLEKLLGFQELVKGSKSYKGSMENKVAFV